MTSTPYLITERLTFYPPTLDSAPLFEQVQTNPAVMQFMGAGARNKESAKLLLMGCVYHQSVFGFSLGPVYFNETKQAIGQAGIYHFNLKEDDPRIEIAFAFLEPYWGQGLATECVRGLQHWASHEKGIHKLFAMVNPHNKASLHVLKKCGFEFKKNASRESVKAQLWAWQAPPAL